MEVPQTQTKTYQQYIGNLKTQYACLSDVEALLDLSDLAADYADYWGERYLAATHTSTPHWKRLLATARAWDDLSRALDDIAKYQYGRFRLFVAQDLPREEVS